MKFSGFRIPEASYYDQLDLVAPIDFVVLELAGILFEILNNMSLSIVPTMVSNRLTHEFAIITAETSLLV